MVTGYGILIISVALFVTIALLFDVCDAVTKTSNGDLGPVGEDGPKG